MKESVVLAAIGDYLEVRGRCFWRMNSGGMFREGRHFALPKHTPRGLPDFFVVAAGQIYGLEVKKPKEVGKTYQSKVQREFQTWFEKHGGMYFVVRSIDDVKAAGL